MKISTGILAFVAVCLLLLNATHANAATNTISIFNFNFGTPPFTHVDPVINVGDTVTWVWSSGSHSTTAAAGQLESWDSGVQTAGTATNFSHTFTNPGTYNYFCSIHGSDGGCRSVTAMSGHVTVMNGTQTAPYQVNGITQQGNDILVSWITGGICETNILQRGTGGTDGSYGTNFTDIFTVSGTLGNITNYLDVGAGTNFPSTYYRVRVPQP